MAGTSLLVLIDDIAAVLNDVALMTKVAAQKTAGLLGDDLAVNAEQVSGVRADRELPVVWAVAKGSFCNKLILVPTALAISTVANWLILPLLMLGGLYLCFEGFEKVAHKFLHSAEEDLAYRKNLESHLSDRTVNMVEFERDKIKGAIRTDFILSAEIIVLTLDIVSTASFTTQVAVLSSIAILMTVGVYGMVAAIVKVDDAGLHLSLKQGNGAFTRFQRWVGARLLALAPLLMRTLTLVGTAAMFLVGGGILVHGLHPVSVGVEHIVSWFGALSMGGPFLQAIAPTVLQALFGIFAGGLALGGFSLWGLVRKK